ncbi:MAG: MFS transporter [Bacteroidia bacterium]|nr:MFS transporter [Bacteroidia bacterium]
MNDNVLKILTSFVAVGWAEAEYKPMLVSMAAGALVLPYLLFSPLASRLPALYSKQKTLRWAKFAELGIMGVAILAFMQQSPWLAIFSVLLMGFQSALYSPSKYALIRDIGGAEGVANGMGYMEGVSFLAMLLGTIAASFMADCDNSLVWYATLMGLAILGYVFSLTLRVSETRQENRSSANPIVFIRETHNMLKNYAGVNPVIHFLSLFWWLCASIQMLLIIFCEEEPLSLSHTSTGILLAVMAIGITIGCILGGKIDSRRFMMGATPLLGIGISIVLILTFAFGTNIYALTALLVILSVTSGIFKIPLDAYIQKKVPAERQGTTLAYFNLISFVYIFIASASNYLILHYLSSRYVFLFLGGIFLVASIIFIFSCREVTCWVGYFFMRWHYNIKIEKRELLQCREGENLLIWPKHQAVMDPIMLFGSFYKEKYRPLVDEEYFGIPVIGHVLSLFDEIPVPDLKKSRKGVEQAMQLGIIIEEALREKTNVLFYPSGHITTDGRETIGNRQLAYNTTNVLPEHTRVVLMHIDGLWGSSWSRYGKRATPSIVKLLLLSLIQIMTLTIFLRKRRSVSFTLEDITEEAKKNAREMTRVEFNHWLEDKFNGGLGI